MLHKHIKETIDGIISTVMSIFFGSISVANIGSAVGILSGLLASVASIVAIIYYYHAIKKMKKAK